MDGRFSAEQRDEASGVRERIRRGTGHAPRPTGGGA
jgi:hypothetical protein